MLEGAVRDGALSHKAVRRAQEVAKARHVTHNIRVIAIVSAAPSHPAGRVDIVPDSPCPADMAI